MQVRRIANRIWEGLASPRTTLLILVVLSLTQITALVLPQIPVPPSQSTAYTRWLAEFRPRLGPQTGMLASLGLLTVRTAPGMRVILGILGLLVAANLDGLREARQDGASSREFAGYGLLALGGLLVIGGWIAQMLWGWKEPGTIVWPGSRIELAQHSLSLEPPTGFLGIWNDKPGLYALNRGKHTGVEVEARRVDEPMLLLPSVDEEPQEILRLTLAAQEPEAFFATEEATLIFRLIRIPGEIQVQIYRSPSGEIVGETVLSGSEEPRVLMVDDAEVTFTPVVLPTFEVMYNPGAMFETLGMVCLAAGTVLRMKFLKTKGPADFEALASSDEAEDSDSLEVDPKDA